MESININWSKFSKFSNIYKASDVALLHQFHKPCFIASYGVTFYLKHGRIESGTPPNIWDEHFCDRSYCCKEFHIIVDVGGGTAYVL